MELLSILLCIYSATMTAVCFFITLKISKENAKLWAALDKERLQQKMLTAMLITISQKHYDFEDCGNVIKFTPKDRR